MLATSTVVSIKHRAGDSPFTRPWHLLKLTAIAVLRIQQINFCSLSPSSDADNG